ncbi:hypothetical protein TNCV_2537621 [Trichonephila clavipes]|nr:hypothetical protein TNCV_2537621 [Trichonephila clavipes]
MYAAQQKERMVLQPYGVLPKIGKEISQIVLLHVLVRIYSQSFGNCKGAEKLLQFLRSLSGRFHAPGPSAPTPSAQWIIRH